MGRGFKGKWLENGEKSGQKEMKFLLLLLLLLLSSFSSSLTPCGGADPSSSSSSFPQLDLITMATTSFVTVSSDSDFPIQNLPYGIFSTAANVRSSLLLPPASASCLLPLLPPASPAAFLCGVGVGVGMGVAYSHGPHGSPCSSFSFGCSPSVVSEWPLETLFSI